MNINPVSDNIVSKPKTVMNLSLGQVLGEYATYDLNAPYQRDECWSLDLKRKLILSIFNGVPIGTIHVVKKEDELSSWVLDAKQRTTAIHQFYKNQFTVEVEIPNSGKKEFLTYQQMLDHENTSIKALAMGLQKSQITVVEWSYMPILEQAAIFEQINSMSTLSVNEDIYCVRFLSKEFINYMLESSIGIISNHFKQKNQRDNTRFAGTRIMHQILCCLDYSAFGLNQLNLSKQSMMKSAQFLHNKYLDLFVEKTEIDDSVVEKMGCLEILSNLKLACKCIQYCFDYKGSYSRKLTSSDFQDIVVGFTQKVMQKKITLASVKENPNLYLYLIAQFIEQKNHEGDLTSKTLDKARLDRRFEIFEETYKKIFLNSNTKCKPVKDIDKTISLLNSGTHCEICQAVLTDKNIAIDHVLPKSKHSQTKYAVICKNCNREKSDLSKNKVQGIFQFIDHNE